MAQIVAKLGGNLAQVIGILHPCTGKLDSLIELLVAAVPVKETRERVVDLITGRFGMAIKQVGDDERRSRIVVAGLHHAHIHHGLLHQTELVPAAQRLGGAHLRPIR